MHNFNTQRLVFFLFIFFSIFVTIGLATNGSYNLFSPSFLWKAYNYYFLGMLDGRLDIPVEAIGREGAYFNGKAYIYYGALSILPRLFLYPFVDLIHTPVSYFSIMFFTIIGHGVLQLSLISVFMKQKRTNHIAVHYLTLIGISCLLWFGSASFMISQNATIYHEPYAAALCLVNIYLALLLKDGFFLDAKTNYSLLPYAILAGLCIHARMPTALALYLVTGLLILIQTYRVRCENGLLSGPLVIIWQSLRTYWLVILILGCFGISILVLNYLKFEGAFRFMGGNYGYFFLEGFTDRRCNIVPTSKFAELFRIIANGYIYLTGHEQGHWSLTWHLATGFGRKEMPLVPLAILWPLPIACFVYVLFSLINGFKKTTNKILLVSLLAFSIGAIFQLKYQTITHRYTAELWVPLFVCLVFLWFKFVSEPYQMQKKNGKLARNILYGVSAVLLLVGISYQLYLATTNKYYLQDGPITKHENFHYSEEDNQFLRSLTPNKIRELNAEFRSNKEEKCAELAEKSGLSELLKD